MRNGLGDREKCLRFSEQVAGEVVILAMSLTRFPGFTGLPANTSHTLMVG
jgi:hypothetical protein